MPAPDVPLLPPRDGEPVFDAPWQAQAFALAVILSERGAFAWPQFARRLGGQLARQGDQSDNAQYYRCWLAALQDLLEEQGAIGVGETAQREAEWREAAARTPHGEPIRLDTADEGGSA